MSVLAFDLGAGSGRGILGTLKNERMEIREIHRFSNDPVQVGNHLHWDILRLFYEVGQGMLKAGREADLRSVGFDTWAVDFGLLAQNGELLGNPYHYRDHHTDGVMDEVFRIVPKEEIFRKTGIQFLPFNTIYQLFALKKNRSPFLEQADALLMIPDLLRYFLTGEKRSEFTNATTTQLFNPLTRNWDDDLIRRLGLPGHLFQKAVEPGSEIGVLRDSVRRELGVGRVPVIAVGEHDTASAVAAVPPRNRILPI